MVVVVGKGGAIGSLRPFHRGTRTWEEAGIVLVLDRKVHEGFWIEGRIFIKVLSIGRRRIKLGIEAPRELTIVREELVEHSASPPNGREVAAPAEAAPEEQEEETFRPVRR